MKRNQKFEQNGDARLMHQVKEELRVVVMQLNNWCVTNRMYG